MIKKTNKILIIGSAPDSVSASNWKNFIFNNIVVINNAWKIRKDWTNCIYPEDFPINKRPKKVNQKQTLHSADDYVKAQNLLWWFCLCRRNNGIYRRLLGII